MREIVTKKYVANDGTEFLTQADCLEYEKHKYAIEKDKAEDDLLKIPHICTNDVGLGFDYSSGEETVLILKLRDENDLKVLNKFVDTFYDTSGPCEKESIGKVLAVRYDRDTDFCWVYDLLAHAETLISSIHRCVYRFETEANNPYNTTKRR